MGGGGIQEICRAYVTPREKTCTNMKIDVNGDNFVDDVQLCGEVTVEWDGIAGRCREQAGHLFPVDKFVEGKSEGSFKAPLAILKRAGTSIATCDDQGFKYYREKHGITAGRLDKGEERECFIKFYDYGFRGYGKRNWLMSHPVQAENGLTIDDLRNPCIEQLIKFNFKGRDIGIGTIGQFTLKDGSKIEGIIVDFGFWRPLGRFTKSETGEYKVDFSPKDVNVFIFTEATEIHKVTKKGTVRTELGEKVNLDDIVGIEDLEKDKVESLARVFKDEHLSITELQTYNMFGTLIINIQELIEAFQKEHSSTPEQREELFKKIYGLIAKFQRERTFMGELQEVTLLTGLIGAFQDGRLTIEELQEKLSKIKM